MLLCKSWELRVAWDRGSGNNLWEVCGGTEVLQGSLSSQGSSCIRGQVPGCLLGVWGRLYLAGGGSVAGSWVPTSLGIYHEVISPSQGQCPSAARYCLGGLCSAKSWGCLWLLSGRQVGSSGCSPAGRRAVLAAQSHMSFRCPPGRAVTRITEPRMYQTVLTSLKGPGSAHSLSQALAKIKPASFSKRPHIRNHSCPSSWAWGLAQKLDPEHHLLSLPE